jgi:hypothetical protein
MEPELYKLTMEVVSDSIKILGPAIITAIVGYKAGQSQLLLKIEELNKNNEFKARDKLFDFHKEKLVKVDESIASLSEALAAFAGMTAGDDINNKSVGSLFVDKYVVSYIDGLTFQLNHINDELKKYPADFPRQLEKINKYIKQSDEFEKPITPEDTQVSIVKLIEIYTFCSHCLRLLIEKEAVEIFKPYLSKVDDK